MFWLIAPIAAVGSDMLSEVNIQPAPAACMTDVWKRIAMLSANGGTASAFWLLGVLHLSNRIAAWTAFRSMVLLLALGLVVHSAAAYAWFGGLSAAFPGPAMLAPPKAILSTSAVLFTIFVVSAPRCRRRLCASWRCSMIVVGP